MTEIHAFDADGTASPGAQTALDNATDGLATEAHIAQAVDDATPGLASETYVDGAVDGLASEAYVNGAVDGLATEQYADNAQQAAISHARVPAMFTYGTTGGIRYAHFRTFAGRPTPGLITKRFATTDDQNTGTGLVPTRETLASFTRRTGAPVAFNASGWKVSGNIGEMRGAQILNGQVFHDFEDFNASPAGVDAIGVRADGTVETYSKRWGDTAASMVADGVVASFSHGPVIVKDGEQQALTDPLWSYFLTEKSARQIVGVNALGELMVTTTEGNTTTNTGLTAPDCAALAATLGYHEAVVMDGGGSAQAYAGGTPVVSSADASKERPVPDALCVIADLVDRTADTGWIDAAVKSGFAANQGNTPQVRRTGNQVRMRRGVNNTGLSASGSFDILTFPAAYAPSESKYIPIAGSSAASTGMAIVNPNGSVTIRTSATLSPYYLLDALSWMID